MAQENFELVQRGFRTLVASMSGYLAQELSRVYKETWWREVLSTLSDQWDLPTDGTYAELTDSLDIANCIRLLDRRWAGDFRDLLPMNCRTWAKELMGVRNIVAHMGQQDLDQPMAERALDTMALLCAEMDPDGAEEIRGFYRTVRARAGDSSPVYTGLAQPEAFGHGAQEGSLLQLVGTEAVQKTMLTRKVSFGGKTTVYPVYRVRLDALYYNDQNDRIATWISRYETENGKDSLQGLSRDIYNRIIENFICDSNPEAITKTKKNIALVGQREPGVTLSDGRIVDGNRRYTCLRNLERETQQPQYFETVLMEMDIEADRKQIKLLELAIQHGEEKKVDYDQIDYAIGTYRDVVLDGLLTVDEYAAGANEPLAEVRKRIAVAEIISEFLQHLKLPEQYYAAREYQVYEVFHETLPLLKKVQEEEKPILKQTVFHNALLKAIPDQRKFIRDIKNLVSSETCNEYFAEQTALAEQIGKAYAEAEIRSKADADRFCEENSALREQLQLSMERALQRARARKLRANMTENVIKSIDLLMDMDPRLFAKLNAEEKDALNAGLDDLIKIAENFKKLL